MTAPLRRSALFFSVSFLQALDNQLIPVLKPALRAEMGAAAGALLPAYALACGTIPFLAAVRGRDRVRALAFGALVVLGCAALAFALVSSAPARLALRAAAGGASGILSMTLLLGAARIEDAAGRAREFTVITAGQLAGVAIGVPLATRFEPQTSNLAIGSCILLLGTLFGAFPKDRPVEAGNAPRLSFRELLRNRAPAMILLATGLAGAVLGGPVGSLGSFLADERHLARDTIGAVYMWAGIGPLLAMPVSGWIARRSPRRVAIEGSLLSALPIGLFPLLAVSWPAAAGVMLACCFVETLRRAALQGALAEAAGAADLQRYLAIRGVILQVGLAAGYAMGEVLLDLRGFGLVCGVSALLSVVAAVVLVRARPASLPAQPA
jgi:predicted MFS family arabinose efflux permease